MSTREENNVEPDNNEYVVILAPPTPESAGKFLLVLYRYESPFSRSTVMFTVDRLASHEKFVQAFRGDDLVAQFPHGADYLLFQRPLARFMTRQEFKDARKADLVSMSEESALMMGADEAESAPPPNPSRGYL